MSSAVVLGCKVSCFHPLVGFRSRLLSSNGRRPIVFNPSEGFSDLRVEIPCGQCIGCRLERSRQWAIRCVHEASLYEDNCFLTLTFDDDNLNRFGSLVKSDFQKFMKRLRKAHSDVKIRYFHCGEYGSRYGRPHHHACIFNFDFDDKILWSAKKIKLYRSPELERLWPYGHALIGDVTWESAAYVARYVLKKITGEKADDFYGGRLPPYVTMSRRPGIGAPWLKKFHADVYPDDSIVVRGNVTCRPAKFYDDMFDKIDEEAFKEVKRKRCAAARKNMESISRLKVKEECAMARVTMKRRKYEEDNVFDS